jgi:hypothetical protein
VNRKDFNSLVVREGMLWIKTDGTPMLCGSEIHPFVYLSLKAQADVCFWERFGDVAPKDYRVILDHFGLDKIRRCASEGL